MCTGANMLRQCKYRRVFIPYMEQVLAVLFILCAGQVCSQQWWRNQQNPFGPVGTATDATGVVSSPGTETGAALSDGTTEGTLGNQVSDDDEPVKEVAIPPGLFPTLEEWTNSTPTSRQSAVEESGMPCMCVPFIQCGKDNVIKTDGGGIIDIRERFGPTPVYNVSTCPYEDNNVLLCCKLPPGATPGPLPAATPPTDAAVAAPVPKPCGTRAGYEVTSDFHRLTGADETSEGEFPWMLALLGPNGGEQNIDTFKCGASLIHPQVALTGAHCIKGPAKGYKILAGEYDTSDVEEAMPHQVRHVTEVVIPDKFNSVTLYNNVALLILDEPVTPADNVGTICLPERGDKFDDEFCVATGWGKTAVVDKKTVISYHPALRKVDLTVTPSARCQQELRTTRLGIFFILNPSFICAIGQRNQDTCSGDGGGPLACPNADDPKRYSLAGVVSWGIGCGSNIPGVYANIAHNRHWIDAQLASRGFAANEPL